jgi:hypothetical protein
MIHSSRTSRFCCDGRFAHVSVYMAAKKKIMRLRKRYPNRQLSEDRTRSSKASEFDAQACRNLASNTRRIRIRKRISLRAFARQTQRTVASLKEFERGEFMTATLGDAEDFAAALRVSILDLLVSPDPITDAAARRSRNSDRS